MVEPGWDMAWFMAPEGMGDVMLWLWVDDLVRVSKCSVSDDTKCLWLKCKRVSGYVVKHLDWKGY